MGRTPPPDAPADEAAIRADFERLEARNRPRPGDLDQLIRHSVACSAAGLAARGRTLLRRWRDNGCRDPDLPLAELMLSVSGASSSARQRWRASGGAPVETAPLEVVNCLFRGELAAAVDLARGAGWFLDVPEATETLGYALIAAGFDEQFEEAEEVVQAWKRRHAAHSPARYQHVLQIEARLAYWQFQYGRELDLMRDAHAICVEHDLETARTYLEPGLAGAHVHCDEVDVAREIIARWAPAEQTGVSPLEGFRDMMRVDLALLEQDADAARAIAQRYRLFGEAMNVVPVTCEARFYVVLTAPADELPQDLAAYRQATYRHQMRRHQRRLFVLEQVAAAGGPPPSRAMLSVRAPDGGRRAPLARLWTPPLEWLSADLLVDRVQGHLMLRGRGPHALDEHPVLHRVLDALLASPSLSRPLEALFEQVWGGSYDPLIHENKVHVALHRLRRWLGERGPGADRLLTVRDGEVGFARRARILGVELPDPAPTAARPGGESVRERVLQCLSGGETLTPRELESRLGVSRSSLHQAMRQLLAAGEVERIGRSRATRYRIFPAGS